MPSRFAHARHLTRRTFMALSGAAVLLPKGDVQGAEVEPAHESRIRGLVIGGVLGDALGGPVEFQEGPLVDRLLPGTRAWSPSRKLTADERRQLAQTLTLYSYEELRPGVESYAQWRRQAPAGTVTDDTRHKIVLMRTLRQAIESKRFPISVTDLAQQYIGFTPHLGITPTGELAEMVEDGFREYRYAARWLQGDRDPARARPLERLWSGEATCSGQMMLTPLAAAFPGDPLAAYRAAFALDFIDSPNARDMAAAIVAGLAAVIDPRVNGQSEQERWQLLLNTMRATDPYRYADVPFAGRPLHYWLDTAAQLARRADGSPARLFQLLETEGRPFYWWDAHFTFLVPIAILHLSEFDPLAALHLTLDFRHDTDSYAHLLAAMAGAVHGEQIFPQAMRDTVRRQLNIDYGEDPLRWCDLLNECHAYQQADQRRILVQDISA